jgi:hypothetical protein
LHHKEIHISDRKSRSKGKPHWEKPRCTINNQQLFFLFFEVYNVNYKGELTSLYIGFSKKSNSHLSVFLSSSENCQFKLMVLVYREGKFKSSAAEYILNLITQKISKKSQNMLLFDNFWIYFETNYNSVYSTLLRRENNSCWKTQKRAE